MTDLAQQLRQAIAEDARTHYALARDAGVEPDLIYRFVDGKDLRFSSVAKIAAALNLQLSQVKKKRVAKQA
jgi:DNA-binding phage protein